MEGKFELNKLTIVEELITTPYKKLKKAELSETEKEENKELSSRRIFVEHLICKLKIFRVASDRFRLAPHLYSQAMETVCGLVRLHLNASFILDHNI
ncbi:transposase family protein [Trichormus azollae]|uniref:transposase family protein n=1 Tax=Trichormus azollae TaxID=1164 RepID=UPI00325ED78C